MAKIWYPCRQILFLSRSIIAILSRIVIRFRRPQRRLGGLEASKRRASGLDGEEIGAMDDGEFRRLISLAQTGDEDAVATLLRRFEPDVRLMVRVRLPRALRTQFDSMDFVQAVWQSVLADREGEPLDIFENSVHFRAFLSGVARNKVMEEYRRRTQTRKYDLNREEPLYIRRGGREEPRDVASSDPTPSQELQAGDRLDQMTVGRPRLEAEIVELRRQGLTFEEIAKRLEVSDRAVRRVIDAVRERLEREDERWR